MGGTPDWGSGDLCLLFSDCRVSSGKLLNFSLSFSSSGDKRVGPGGL